MNAGGMGPQRPLIERPFPLFFLLFRILTFSEPNIARDQDGNVIGEISLPRDDVRQIVSLGNQFAPYGVSGSNVCRIIIDPNLQVISVRAQPPPHWHCPPAPTLL